MINQIQKNHDYAKNCGLVLHASFITIRWVEGVLQNNILFVAAAAFLVITFFIDHLLQENTDWKGVYVFSSLMLCLDAFMINDHWWINLAKLISSSVLLFFSYPFNELTDLESAVLNKDLATVINHSAFEAAKVLIENGADVNKSNSDGDTPLSSAIYCEQKDLIELLIEKGADLNKVLNDGRTLLMAAIQFQCNEEIITTLIKKGADVNKSSSDGWTPLTVASDGQLNIVKILIENGADINKKTGFGKTALDIANEFNHEAIAEVLKEAVNKPRLIS